MSSLITLRTRFAIRGYCYEWTWANQENKHTDGSSNASNGPIELKKGSRQKQPNKGLLTIFGDLAKEHRCWVTIGKRGIGVIISSTESTSRIRLSHLHNSVSSHPTFCLYPLIPLLAFLYVFQCCCVAPFFSIQSSFSLIWCLTVVTTRCHSTCFQFCIGFSFSTLLHKIGLCDETSPLRISLEIMD